MSRSATSLLSALPPKWRAIIVLVAIAGTVGYHFWDRSRGGKGIGIFASEETNENGNNSQRRGGMIDTDNQPANTGSTGAEEGGVVEKVNGWDVLRAARLLEFRNNDGDSFLVGHGDKEYEFRLYFVDTPEKRVHQYNGERIEEQARYFGISTEKVIEVGLEAKKLMEELLGKEPFTVYTKWDEVFDSGRYFVFVEFANPDGQGTSLLAEELTEAGLSRIHTEGATLPNGESQGEFRAHLKGIEREAKRAKRGGWRK